MMYCLLLIAIQVYHVGAHDNKEWHYECAPEGAHHNDHSPDGREGDQVTEANRADCYDDNPYRLEKLVEIYETQLPVIDNLEHS